MIQRASRPMPGSCSKLCSSSHGFSGRHYWHRLRGRARGRGRPPRRYRGAAAGTEFAITHEHHASTRRCTANAATAALDWSGGGSKKPALARRPDLYLLCATEVPWLADGVRDRGHLRDEMQALFAAAVAQSGAPWVELRGAPDLRAMLAGAAIDRLMFP